MKDAYWFKHDSNARHDGKMLLLRAQYGLEGIGFYWCLIEFLREQDNYKLPREHVKVLYIDLACEKNRITVLLNYCVEIGLIKQDEEYYWSDSLINRMEHHENIKQERSKAGKKGMRYVVDWPFQPGFVKIPGNYSIDMGKGAT